jgi:hypothetical protein
MIDHFQTVAIDVNFSFDTGAIQRFTDIFQRPFTPLAAFRFAEYIDSHDDPPSFGQIYKAIHYPFGNIIKHPGTMASFFTRGLGAGPL